MHIVGEIMDIKSLEKYSQVKLHKKKIVLQLLCFYNHINEKTCFSHINKMFIQIK